MTLSEFTEATVQVIGQDGIADYLPTLLHDDEIKMIEGIPAAVDHRDAIQNVIRRNKIDGSEFYFAVKSGESQITVGHCRPGQPTSFMLINQVGRELQTQPLESCEWWTIGS